MEDMNRESIRAQVAQALQQIEIKSSLTRPSQRKYGAYHEAAAVLTTFDHKQLKPAAEGADPGEMDLLLANSRIVSQPGGATRWELLPEVRREVLKQLGGMKEWRRALDANQDRSVDDFQKIFEAYMGGEAPPLEKQDIRQLAATLQVVDWLEGLVSGLPDEESIRQRHDLLSLLQPFYELAGEHFRGRKKELQELREYVGVLPPGSMRERIKRHIAKVFDWKDQPPLVIHGPGGLGKSTLVARFIWEHAMYTQAEQFPWIYIDFDRPGMHPENPPAILLEGIRQLGIQYPHARSVCEQIRFQWRSRIARQNSVRSKPGSPRISTVTRLRDWEPFLEDFANLLTNLKVEKDPLLFVLDTFEEVQYRGEVIVRNLLEFLQRVQGRVPRLRTIIAGRAPIDEFPEIPTRQMLLPDFDMEAAQGFLEAGGVSPAEVAKSIAAQVGGNPLSLRLAVTVWQKEGVNKSGQLDLKTRGMLGFRIRENEIQGLLFERNLEHIHDPEVSKIAYPGLALRRITPELIRSVLAQPCELALSSDEDVQSLFNGLKREVWLVSAEEDSVRHRPDVRRIMIRLLREREPRKSRLIDEAAVKYYDQQTGPVARAEEIYHRLVLQQSEEALNQHWDDDPEVQQRLYSAVDEFEMREKVWLKSRLAGITLTEEERSRADHEGWEREVAARVEHLLAAGLAKEALVFLREREKRVPASRLYGLEAQALEMLGRREEAQRRIQDGLASSFEVGNVATALELQIRLARLATGSGQIPTAIEALDQAEKIIGLRGQQNDRLIEMGLVRLAILRQKESPPAELEEQQRRLRDLFAELSDAEIVDSPALIGQLVGEIGEKFPDLLWRSVRLLGIGSPRHGPLRKLASALTEWDRQISQSANLLPGSLARTLQIPERGSLDESWDGYIVESTPEMLEKMIARLQEKYPVVDPAVRAAIAQLLAERIQPSTQIVSGQGVLTYEQSTSLSGNLNDLPGAVEKVDLPAVSVDGQEQKIESKPASISLSVAERAELIDSLVNAFALEELRALLGSRLNISLDAISFSRGSLVDIVNRVVRNAESGGWLAQLLAAALESRPGSVQLQTLAAKAGLATAVPEEANLEKTLKSSESLFNVTEWRAQLGYLETKICRLEISSGRGMQMATAFLVGPSIVMTAYHVMADVIAGKVTPDRVLLRFDYRQLSGGNVISTGTVFQLAPDWLVDYSPSARSDLEPDTPDLPGVDELDYVLLRVAGEPGNQPVGGERAESNANRRGWIDIPIRMPELRQGMPLFILHHPMGKPLNLSLDMEGVLGFNTNGTRILYTTSTAPGSAGAPCFNQNWELVAMHHAALSRPGESDVNQGIPISAILNLLEKRRLRFVLGSPTSGSGGVARTKKADSEAIDVSLQAILEARGKGNQRAEAIELGKLGRAIHIAGRTQEAIKFYEQALQIARAIGDPYIQADQLGNLGHAYAEMGQSQIPFDYFFQAIELMQASGDKRKEMMQWINVGDMFITLGDAQHAIQPYQQALDLASSMEDKTWVALLSSRLGQAYSALEDFARAIEYYRQALETAEKLELLRVVESALGDLGNTYLRLQDPARAISFYDEQLKIVLRTQDREGQAKVLGSLGRSYREMGDLQRARSYHEEQLKVAVEIGDLYEQAWALSNLGYVHKRLDDAGHAAEYFEQARSIWKDTNDITELATITLDLAILYAEQGQTGRALSLAHEAEENLARIGSPMAQAAQRLLAELEGGASAKKR